MAENTLLFCLIVNWPLLPRTHLQNLKEYLTENEATSANEHGDKRIIYFPPFWYKVCK